MANKSKHPNALADDDPFWFDSALLEVKKRHNRAGTRPATFGDLIREADELCVQKKAAAGIKPRGSPSP